MATIAEQLHHEGRQEGRREGRVEGEAIGRQAAFLDAIRRLLAFRFGDEGLALMPQIETIADPERLEALHRRILEVNDLEAFRSSL